MNVLLVYPRDPDTFWSFRHAPRKLHAAMELAIIGHHFRTVAERL